MPPIFYSKMNSKANKLKTEIKFSKKNLKNILI
jgi:hypothetical protein